MDLNIPNVAQMITTQLCEWGFYDKTADLEVATNNVKVGMFNVTNIALIALVVKAALATISLQSAIVVGTLLVFVRGRIVIELPRLEASEPMPHRIFGIAVWKPTDPLPSKTGFAQAVVNWIVSCAK